MKLKTTRKRILECCDTVIRVGYCDLQHLFCCENPIAYTAGVYGWNCDIYKYGHAVIATGYRPFGNIKPDYSVNRRYNELAESIVNDTDISWQERREELDTLANQYIREVTGKD